MIKVRDLAYFSPLGKRGVGFSRTNLFGKNFEKMDVKTKPFIVAMIEDISAINNLDEILNVRGLDAILIGPYDLSCSLKITGKFNPPKV